MGFPGMEDMPAISFYQAPPPGLLELNLGDTWRARYVEATDLPEGIPAAYGYALVMMDDKGYVVRPKGATKWGTVEGDFNSGEAPAGWLKRALAEQANAVAGDTALIGYLECRATSHNPDFDLGAMTVRPLYRVAARQVKDMPSGAQFERRRLPMNEYTMAIRNHYPEVQAYLIQGIDGYVIRRAKGEL